MSVTVCSRPGCQTSAGCRCGEKVIILPVIRVDRQCDSDQQAIQTVRILVRIPAKTWRRLSNLSDQWALTPVEVAEALLLNAINKSSRAS